MELNPFKIQDSCHANVFSTLCSKLNNYSEIFIKAMKNKKIRNISDDEFNAIKSLKNNHNIIICHVDKEDVIVVLGSYNHELSKYLYDIIKNNRPSQSFSYIRDSFECVKVTTGIPNSVNQTMISFDVDNLYTNVPVHEAIVTTLYMLFKTSKSLDAAYTRFQFGELIKIAVCDIPFRFQDKIYTQIDGVVMGSPLGPIFLHLFMSNFEQKINRFSTNKLLTWIRYVDDIFYIFDKQQSIKEFLKRINKWHHNIKFTSEKGSDALKENKKLVYKIPCSNCNKCHLGETNREKEIRMKEHQADIKNHTQCSNVAKHANENKHSLNFI
ncbi:unnamed protein product [Rotaria socialis]|uniref:Reverse transcriptase domain-containing protein n=2 Tax=Rotaria socialis TaxID=392032 RepID=A0A818E7F6_9BILA|nr:unnamed protein product [Rotaria socialis]CAF4681746.1 unnamed protein product [Rotaria socialis]CAF4941701.1 unnamed protein product [Rotaria socialis]